MGGVDRGGGGAGGGGEAYSDAIAMWASRAAALRRGAARTIFRNMRFALSDSAAPLITPKSSLTLIEPLLSSSASLMRSKTSISHFSTLPSPSVSGLREEMGMPPLAASLTSLDICTRRKAMGGVITWFVCAQLVLNSEAASYAIGWSMGVICNRVVNEG